MQRPIATAEPDVWVRRSNGIFSDLDGFRLVKPAALTGERKIFIVTATIDEDVPVGSVLRNTATLQEPPGVDIDGNGTTGEEHYGLAWIIQIVEPAPVFWCIIKFPHSQARVRQIAKTMHLFWTVAVNLPATVPAPRNLAFLISTLSDVYLAENDAVWAIRNQLLWSESRPSGEDLVNPVIIEDLPPQFDFVQDAQTGNFVQMIIRDRARGSAIEYTIPFNNPACSNPDITVIDNYNGTGRDRLILEFPGLHALWRLG